MAIDGATYIHEFNTSSPNDSDNRSEGAGQIRAIKSVIKRTFPYLDDKNPVDYRPFIPLGLITMYSGTKEALTPGWEMCDSTRVVNGVRIPDLRGKFIMAATDQEKVGQTGGRHVETNMAQYVKGDPMQLDLTQIPSHNHTIPDMVWVSGHHGGTSGGPMDATRGRSTGFTGGDPSLSGKSRAHAHGISHNKNMDVRPAYHVLAFIIFVGVPEK